MDDTDAKAIAFNGLGVLANGMQNTTAGCKLSRISAKGLQLATGENFQEIYGPSGCEEVQGVPGGSGRLVMYSQLSLYTVHINCNPKDTELPCWFTYNVLQKLSWFCQVCGWGKHHFTQCSSTMDVKGEIFVPTQCIKRAQTKESGN